VRAAAATRQPRCTWASEGLCPSLGPPGDLGQAHDHPLPGLGALLQAHALGGVEEAPAHVQERALAVAGEIVPGEAQDLARPQPREGVEDVEREDLLEAHHPKGEMFGFPRLRAPMTPTTIMSARRHERGAPSPHTLCGGPR
jgi:hypothetical protein